MAMGIDASCNSNTLAECGANVTPKHRGICPPNWHIPTDDEWTMLINFVESPSIAGTQLKATSGWYDDSKGTDNYGFSALPGGTFFYNSFKSNQTNVSKAINTKSDHYYSVRCVKDNID